MFPLFDMYIYVFATFVTYIVCKHMVIMFIENRIGLQLYTLPK